MRCPPLDVAMPGRTGILTAFRIEVFQRSPLAITTPGRTEILTAFRIRVFQSSRQCQWSMPSSWQQARLNSRARSREASTRTGTFERLHYGLQAELLDPNPAPPSTPLKQTASSTQCIPYKPTPKVISSKQVVHSSSKQLLQGRMDYLHQWVEHLGRAIADQSSLSTQEIRRNQQLEDARQKDTSRRPHQRVGDCCSEKGILLPPKPPPTSRNWMIPPSKPPLASRNWKMLPQNPPSGSSNWKMRLEIPPKPPIESRSWKSKFADKRMRPVRLGIKPVMLVVTTMMMMMILIYVLLVVTRPPSTSSRTRSPPKPPRKKLEEGNADEQQSQRRLLAQRKARSWTLNVHETF